MGKAKMMGYNKPYVPNNKLVGKTKTPWQGEQKKQHRQLPQRKRG